MEKYSAHDVMEINSREIVNAPVKDNHTKRCWWIYVKNKRLMGANWCPRYAVLESVKTENVQEGLPLYKTVIKIYKEPGKKVLVKIPVDEVLEFHSADDIDLEKLDKSNGGSWGKIMVFIRDKEKYELAVKNMGDSEEWKQVLGEIEYYVSLRREIGFPKSTPERHEYDRKPFKKLIRKAKKSLGCGKVCPQKQNLKSADSDYDKKWRTRQSLFVSREFEYLDLLKYDGSYVLHHADLNLLSVEPSLVKHDYGAFFCSESENSLISAYFKEYLKIMGMGTATLQDIRKKDDAYLNFMSRFRDEATRNSKIIIDEYHKTEVTQSFPSDLNLSGSSHVYRVGTDPTTRFNGKGHMNKHNGLCRSRSSVAAIGSSKSFADAYHGSEYRLYGKKIREDKGITFSIIPPTQGYCGKFGINIKKIELEIQGINMIMAETSHCDNYAKVYPTPIVLVEYKGFAVIAELSYLTDENRLNLVHALRSPSVRQDKSVFEKLLNLSKLFNLQPHSIITEGLCFNNVISSGVVGYTVNGRQDIFLKNLRNLLPLDHICGVDNSYCKVSDSTASKHLGAKGTCKDSMVFSSIESDIMASVSIPAGGKSKSVLSLTVNENHRFRPEFLSLYAGKELSSDSFTIYSSGDSEEAAKNNQKSTEASNFLRTGWIPMFANALDSLEFRPLESSSLTNVMHYCGINMRYLGSIAKCIKLPMLKHLVVIEMVARATKVLFREKMRERILYFTKIGATKVYEEEARRTIRMINGVLNVKNGVSPTSNVVCNLVMKKFNYSITPGDLSDINPQSLLNAIQYNWGLRIEGELSGTTGLIQKKVKITYLPKTKAPMAPYSAYTHCNDAVCSGSLVNHKKLSGSAIGDPVSSEFVRNYIAYFLHRYFAGINAKSKMKSSDATAEVLVTVSAYYNQLHLSKEAEVYALTAINNEPPNDLWKGLAYYQILVSKVNSIITNKRGVCATQNALIDEFVKSVRPQLSETYESSIFYMQNNLQDSHLGLVAVHDAIANACIVYGLYDEAITYLKKSWKISQNALGNNHIATGYYAAKIGRYYLRAMNYRDAIYWLEICQKVLFDTASYEMALTSSEVELCLAEAYLRSGDHDKALYYAEFSTNVRSTKLGNINPYTISSYILLIEVLMISLNKNIGQDFKQIVNRKKVLSLLGKVFLFIKLYGKNACSGDVCGWLDSIENISKKDLYKKGSAGENPYEALYIKLLSEAVGSGYIHKVEATENIESLICDNAVGKTRVPCQFSEIIMRKNPLSSALSNPILISGPLLDHKFAVLPEINIHTLYSVISKVFFMKLKDVKDGDAKCIINKISSRVREKGDIYARSAIPEVIKGIYVVGPELYFDGVIHRVDEKDPTVVSELEANTPNEQKTSSFAPNPIYTQK